MFVIASEAVVPGSPERLWNLLTDFALYPLWTRCVDLAGDATLGSALSYGFRIWRPDGSDGRIAFAAVVDAVEPARLLSWSLGVPAIFVLRFRFDLGPEGGGTTLRHSVEAGGVLADTLRGRFERQLGPVVRALVADAARAFDGMPRPLPDPQQAERRP